MWTRTLPNKVATRNLEADIAWRGTTTMGSLRHNVAHAGDTEPSSKLACSSRFGTTEIGYVLADRGHHREALGRQHSTLARCSAVVTDNTGITTLIHWEAVAVEHAWWQQLHISPVLPSQYPGQGD